MHALSDFQFAWDLFWSRCTAQFSKEHLHTARFAYLHELTHLLSHRSQLSLLLGIGARGRILRVQPTLTKPELGNVLDIGAPRCGKSQREKGQLLDWKGSAIVNDIKGEHRRDTAGARAREGRIVTIDISGRGNKFDPLAGRITETQLYASAHQLLYRPTDKETYFTERATKMLTQLFLAALRRGIRPLPFVGRLVCLGLNQVAKELNAISPILASRFLEAEYVPAKDYEESKSRMDAWSTLSSRLYPLLTEEIVRSFDGSDFTARDLLFSEEPITVYFCWPEAELPSLQPLIRLIWGSLITDLIATYDLVGGRGCREILLSLDEAGRTDLPLLPEYTATLNSRGISISMSGQSFEQFKSLYGEFRAKTLLDNMDTRIIHRVHSFETAKDIERWLGYTSGWAASHSTHEGGESEGKSEREVPLMTARQIAQLKDEEILIFHRELPPIQGHRLALDRFPAFAKSRKIAPPPLPQLQAPAAYPQFPLWNRRYVGSGMYRLPTLATGYSIPLPGAGGERKEFPYAV